MGRPRGKPKKTSGENSRPESENDYLEQADAFESSGSKWKAGDAEKALRFYQKAVTAYIEGLSRYPRSFDLAYNKALLLYHITQEKRIAPLVGSVTEVLKEALDAHRFALSIDGENPDVLFNTAQVLTSFAEELGESAGADGGLKGRAVALLQEAVEMFAACLERQEVEYSQIQEMQNAADESLSWNGKEQAPPSSSKDTESREGEQWAVVLESITPDTLIETALAQLGSLSSLATVAAPTSSTLLANLSEIATPIVTQKLPSYIALLPTSIPKDALGNTSTPFLAVSTSSSTFHPDTPAHATNPQSEAKTEADLAVAIFKCALSSAEHKSNLTSTETHTSRINEAFSALLETTNKEEATPIHSSIQIHSAHADILIDLADTLAEKDASQSDPDPATAQTRWTCLTQAQNLLTKVTTLLSSLGTTTPDLPSRAQIYLQRGDIELLRSNLAHLPSATSSISASLPTLLKNAGVYYRGAAGLAGKDGDGEEAPFHFSLVIKKMDGQLHQKPLQQENIPEKPEVSALTTPSTQRWQIQ
ncbi:hypothetical protein EG328_006937 [Venturia inaequalis]|uniref:Uncharacterized protein n=1 Tax=Venturia inaequalis TaxID=5025 RepID=A0A8H3UEX7_VENIN|nr:hypothetical protein EG328_006937 [Venturia inaequalis]